MAGCTDGWPALHFLFASLGIAGRGDFTKRQRSKIISAACPCRRKRFVLQGACPTRSFWIRNALRSIGSLPTIGALLGCFSAFEQALWEAGEDRSCSPREAGARYFSRVQSLSSGRGRKSPGRNTAPASVSGCCPMTKKLTRFTPGRRQSVLTTA